MGAKWDSVLPINGTEAEVDALRDAVLTQRAAEKVLHLLM